MTWQIQIPFQSHQLSESINLGSWVRGSHLAGDTSVSLPQRMELGPSVHSIACYTHTHTCSLPLVSCRFLLISFSSVTLRQICPEVGHDERSSGIKKGEGGAPSSTMDVQKKITCLKSTTAAALISVVNQWGGHVQSCDLLLLLLLFLLLQLQLLLLLPLVLLLLLLALQLLLLLLRLPLLLPLSWRLSDELGSSGIIFLLVFPSSAGKSELIAFLNCSCCFVFSFLKRSRMENCHWLFVISLRLQLQAINRPFTWHSRILNSFLSQTMIEQLRCI